MSAKGIIWVFVACMVLAYDKPGWVTFVSAACLWIGLWPEKKHESQHTYRVIR